MKIIKKYYKDKAYYYLVTHSKLVSKKAIKIAKRFKEVNLRFIEEASMLHDIGIFETDAPLIYCYGKEPYIKHGYLGRILLEKEGFPKHALVCERHIGVGITKEDIKKQKLPLPLRDMVPLSMEEKIICYADKFYSKTNLTEEKKVDEIARELKQFGKDKVFLEWVKEFGT